MAYNSDIFGRLSSLTKSFKNLCCRLGILEQTVAECCEGGGGGTNPTNKFMPYNNAGTFDDSFLQQDDTTLKTVYLLQDQGLNLDFNSSIYTLGDTTRSFIVDGDSDVIKTHFNGEDRGLKLDFANQEFILGNQLRGFYNNDVYSKIGDYSGGGGGTLLTINDDSSLIKSTFKGTDLGLNLDFGTYSFQLGDIHSTVGYNSLIDVLPILGIVRLTAGMSYGTNLELDDYFGITQTNNGIGLKLNFGNKEYALGDTANASSAKIVVTSDPSNEKSITSYIDNAVVGFNISGNGTEIGTSQCKLLVDYDLNIITSSYSSENKGLKLDFGAELYCLGDYDTITNKPGIVISGLGYTFSLSSYRAPLHFVIESQVSADLSITRAVDNINLSTVLGDYYIKIPGVYRFTNYGTGNGIIFPDPLAYPGHTLVIINAASHNIPINSPNTFYSYAGVGSFGQIREYRMLTFYSIGSEWVSNDYLENA